jgi:hypothetical protein
MSLAVAHVQSSGRIRKHTMWSSKRAPARIRLGSIAALARAEHCADDASLRLNFSNDVVLSVGHVE